MINLNIKFYVSSSYIFHAAIILLTFCKKYSQKFHHFLSTTPHMKPWPYIKSHSLFTSSGPATLLFLLQENEMCETCVKCLSRHNNHVKFC